MTERAHQVLIRHFQLQVVLAYEALTMGICNGNANQTMYAPFRRW